MLRQVELVLNTYTGPATLVAVEKEIAHQLDCKSLEHATYDKIEVYSLLAVGGD
ncbi:hypothetical protein [Paenibacillus sp. UMB4589-SE434]|uniref:hypothetical protein n=1 Tax=Paenibacillus sp. UMB4589-SE434 TaxID=3046314 RepID=UPI00254DE0E0|nr:hypothetical protein [Paenibacillus sp. UMB4589-SE434]MDK8183445.1 hypothetical protein [Paenibacillus sp. UMB4589-SE434]